MTVEKGGTTKRRGEGSYINMTKMKSGFFSFDLEELQVTTQAQAQASCHHVEERYKSLNQTEASRHK